MTLIQTISNSAELAFAAYARLSIGENSPIDLKTAGSDMVDALATSLANQYRVIALLDDTASGAYAAVFENKLTGERTLAIRGTTDLKDILADSYVLTGVPASLNPQYQVLARQVAQWQADGVVNSSTELVGHSLGGYLATALKSSFPDALGSVYTFNAPGLGSTAGTLGEFFQSTFGIGVLSSDVFDVRGTAGLSLIAGLGQHWGNAVPVEIEAAPGNGLGNHSIGRLVLSLAVFRMWSALDPSLTIERANQLLACASEQANASLEASIGFTLSLISGPTAAVLPLEDAETFYARVLDLTAKDGEGRYTHPTFSTLAGQLRIAVGGADLAAAARQDFGALLSLIQLSPLVLRGTDTAGQAALDTVLQSAWADTHSLWQADRAAVAAGQTAENYSDGWLADRALLLEVVGTFNASGSTTSQSLPADRYLDLQWRDGAGSLHSLLASAAAAQPFDSFEILPTQRVAFGGESGDVLTGTANTWGDHLYGGGGNDTVAGLIGNDELEGNAGDDWLDGGEGNDALRGGMGADTLDGGSGLFSDTLNGGAGGDLYIVGANAGIDLITSSDTDDRLEFNGRRLDGSGTLMVDAGNLKLWKDLSVSGEGITYSLDTASHELLIQGAGSTARIRDFESGDLGIRAPVADNASPGSSTVFVDLGSGDYSGGWRDDGFSAPAGSAEHLINFNMMQPVTLPMRLTIDTRGGNDWIEGGSAISGVPLQVTAGSGDDRLYAGITQTLAEVLAAQDTATANGRSELLLDGGAGHDSVFGGAGDDALFGGQGDDTLVGGAGRDVIFSDGDSGQTLYVNAVGQRWVDGDNTTRSTLYFNGYPLFGTIYSGYSGSLGPTSGESQYYNLQFGLESTDFTSLGSLAGVVLAPSDYLAGWTVRADGRFDGSAAQRGGPDPEAALYFNTNRHSGNDIVFAGSGNDLINAGGGNDYIDAGSGDDVASGFQGDDQIIGGTGNDSLLGDSESIDPRAADSYLGAEYRRFTLDPARADQQHGADFIDGGDGNDVIDGNGGNDTLLGGRGNDDIFGDDSRVVNGLPMRNEYAGSDVIDAGEGNDFVAGGAGADVIAGGLGVDSLYGDNVYFDNLPGAGRTTAAGNDTLDGNAGDDLLFGEGGDDLLRGGDGNDQLEADGKTTQLRAEVHGNDTLDGGNGNDRLWGGGGADLLIGGDGNDWLAGEDQRTLDAQSTLSGNDTLWGGAGADTLIGGTGADVLIGGAGNDVLIGGAGADIYVYNLGDGADTLIDLDGSGVSAIDELRLGAGITAEQVKFMRLGGDLALTFGNGRDQLTLSGWLNGGSQGGQIESIRFANGTLWSAEMTTDLASQTRGTDGNDRLRGDAAYADKLIGLAGNDTLIATGNDDTLDGGDGDDLLDATEDRNLVHAVTHIGGRGNDTLVGSLWGDTYVFRLGDGADTLINNVGPTGTSGVNELRLEGIASTDMSLARDGDDLTLRHANGIDQVTIKNWYLNVYDQHRLKSIVFTDTTLSADEASRRGQPPILGTPGNDNLSGTLTPERIVGGAGNDTLTANGIHDQLEGGEGDDLLRAVTLDSYTYAYGEATFIGGPGNDTIEGSAFGDTYRFELGDGADVILETQYDDHTSSNQLSFGTGILPSDITPVRSGLALVFRHANGTDQIQVAGWFRGAMRSTYTQTELEFPLTAVHFADGTEWSGADITQRLRHPSSTGTAGDDLIIGTDAVETLSGLGGNDLLMAWGSGDRLEGGAGNDLLVASELASDSTLMGGLGDDTMYGSRGRNVFLFNLGDGADTLQGAEGSGGLLESSLRFGSGILPRDIAMLRVGNDLLLRHSKGSDQVTVKGWFGDYYARLGSVEFDNKTSWSADYITQRLLQISGTTGNDSLTGGFFSETLLGLAGNDTLTAVGNGDTLDGGAGDDTLRAESTSYGSGYQGITFIGGRGNDRIVSRNCRNEVYQFNLGDGADTITDFDESNGYALDELRFGAKISASDISVLRSGDDLILRHANRTDQVTFSNWFTSSEYQIERVGFADGSVWTFDDIQARVRPTGTAGDDHLIGTNAADSLEGLAGNDTLDGGAGADTLLGGLGDDAYVVDNALDVVTEKAGQGIDRVDASINWTLGANVENLLLTGSTATNGSGNGLANQLVGNDAANQLSGLAGNDSMRGGAGADTLLGGTGDDHYLGGAGADTLTDSATTSNDVYAWGRGEGADVLSDSGGVDRLDILAGVSEDQLWLQRVGNNLQLSIIGTADSLTINGWYASTARQVESFQLSDGQALQASQVQRLVDAMAAFAPPAAGQTTLPPAYQSALLPVIAPSWV